MLRQLASGRIPARDRPQFRERLIAAPWIWPRPSNARAYTSAQLCSGLAGPPPSQPGRTLLLSVHDGGDSVWLAGTDALQGLSESERAEYGTKARAAWKNAAIAASRSVDVLWESITAIERTSVTACRLGTRSRRGLPSDPLFVDGLSFGLPFLLAIVSRAFGTAVASNLAASGEVLPNGEVHKVRDLDRKLDALTEVAPQVTRMIVAESQRAEAIDAARGRLEIIPVSTAAQAIARAFGDAPRRLLMEMASDRERAVDLAARLFKLSMHGRGECYDWAPVERAADAVLQTAGATLDDFSRYSLELTRAVAARHRNNSGVVALPTDDWLAQLSPPAHDGVLATLVQHTADTGSFNAAVMEERARARLPVQIAHSTVTQLKLAGALGRLLAVTGRPDEALRLAEAAVSAFEAMPDEERNTSYALSEWLRLAGACDQADTFTRAEQRWRSMAKPGAMGDGAQYVELSRLRGAMMLDLWPGDGERCLAALIEAAATHDGVRWSAARWLIRAYDRAADRTSAEALVATIKAAASAGSDAAERSLVLIALDRAVTAGDQSAAESAAAQLLKMQPGVCGHLERVAAGPGFAAYVSRYFPY